jgi:(E)-4-hydroxy-3-methylbut-2-enyl-diphosphate synthase
MTYREHTRKVRIGDRTIGGGSPILIQSMTNTPTEDVEATVSQILELEKAGCDIIRCTVPDAAAAEALGQIKKEYISRWSRIFILTTAWRYWP